MNHLYIYILFHKTPQELDSLLGNEFIYTRYLWIEAPFNDIKIKCALRNILLLNFILIF